MSTFRRARRRLAQRMFCVQCASIQDVLNVKNEVVTLVCGHSRARMTSEGKVNSQASSIGGKAAC